MSYNNKSPRNYETYFIDPTFHNKIDIVIGNMECTVNFKENGEQRQKVCYVTVEKIDSQCLMQIRITEATDQKQMFISMVDGDMFQRIKKNQSLHVTYSGFVENLIGILNNCRKGDLQISLVIQENSESYLQFFEIRSFRNLTHLSLPIQKANLQIVLFYMRQTIDLLQEKELSYTNTVQHMECELMKKDDHILKLQNEITKLNTNLNDQKKMLSCRRNEELIRLQQNIKNISDAKELEENRLKEKLNNIQNRLEQIMQENSILKEEKIQELRKTEKIHQEIHNLKSNSNNIQEQNEKLLAELASLKNVGRKNEMYMSDLKKQLQDCQETIKLYDKSKSELKAELQAEKNMYQLKKNALQVATQEISKANDIITNQVKEITHLRKTISWRTEVALQQEAALRNSEKQITNLRRDLLSFGDELKTNKDVSGKLEVQLDTIQTLSKQIENKYSEKVENLQHKIEEIGKQNLIPRRIIRKDSR